MGEEMFLSIDPGGILEIEVNNKTFQKSLPQPMVGGFCFNKTLDEYNYYDIAVVKEADIVSVSSCTNCSYSYAVCDNAEKNGWCNLLSTVGLFPGLNTTCCTGHCLCCP
jgi:hypothetical protein